MWRLYCEAVLCPSWKVLETNVMWNGVGQGMFGGGLFFFFSLFFFLFVLGFFALEAICCVVEIPQASCSF